MYDFNYGVCQITVTHNNDDVEPLGSVYAAEPQTGMYQALKMYDTHAGLFAHYATSPYKYWSLPQE